MPVRLMSLASHRLILGNTLTLDIPSGHELRADWKANGTTGTATVIAGAAGAEFRPSELGRYYLATREDSTSDYARPGCWRSSTSSTTTMSG